MVKKFLFLMGLWLLSHSLTAQYENVGFGFRAGLNYSKFTGPYETAMDGTSFEKFSVNNGFHIGAAVSFKFTDLVGLHVELMYSQRGTKYEYSGPSYFILGQGVQKITLLGTRKQSLSVNNAYLDIPVLGYYKIGKLEVFGGFNSGLLVGSTGGGTVNFEGQGSAFSVRLDHNYKKDKAGEASTETQTIVVNGLSYTEPATLGAYYDFEKKDKTLYKTLDFGVVAGLSYFLNGSLYLSGRYVWGLGDVDRNNYDVSLHTPNTQRADTNKSRSMQISLGFSF